MKRLLLLLAFLAPCVAWAQTDPLNAAYKPTIDCTPGDYPANVSLTNSLAKLRQGADSPTSITQYGSTPLPCLTVNATQNEIRSFQAHVKAPGGGYAALTFTMSTLVKTTGPGGNFTITGENTKPTFSAGSESGTTATFTTTAAHNLYNNQAVLITGCTPSGYNGGGRVGAGVQVTNVTATTFQFTTIASGLGAASGCSITPLDIIPYAVGYNPVTTPSGLGSGGTTNTLFGVAGNYPDPLIPAVDPYYGQTTAAFPINVAANNNQSAWFDVHVPPNAPSGWYSGTVTISNSGTTIATLPVLYAVWQWPASSGGFMPSSATLQDTQGVSFSNLCRLAYGSSGSAACTSAYNGGLSGITDDLATELLDDRLNLGSLNSSLGNAAVGTLTTAETNLVNGNASGRLTTILKSPKLGPPDYFSQSIPSTSSLQTWMTTFNTNGWLPKPGTFIYGKDEPGNTCANWTSAISLASTSRTVTPNIPVLITTSWYDGSACSGLNSTDLIVNEIVCASYASGGCNNSEPSGAYEEGNDTNYTTWLAANCCSGTGPARATWLYTDCLPNCGGGHAFSYPSYDADQFPVANEAMEWNTMRTSLGTAGFNVSGELYFLLDGCFYGINGSSADPWSGCKSLGNWGDGSLLYYGTNLTHCPACTTGAGAVNVNVPIFLPSIRLKYMRDGKQDYEYMYLLKQSGATTLVKNQISSWMTNAYTFNVTATAPSGTFTGDMTDARNNIGAAVHALTFSGGGGGCGSSAWINILACSRAIDWTKAGVTTGANAQTGAIPSDSWTQCGTTIAAYTGTAATISNAITACSGFNQYVLLGPGTFTLSTGITFANANHVELRGSGSDKTFILMNGQDSCGGNNAGICIGNGIVPNSASNGNVNQPRAANAADWTGTVEGGAGVYPANAVGLTVANIGSAGGGIHQGQFITVDQAGAGTTGSGLNDCTDFSIANNACLQDNASTGNRIVPSSIGVGLPVTVVVSGTGTTVTLTPATGQNASFSTAWVNIPTTVYSGGPGGTPTSVIIASVASTTVLTLASPIANGSYTMSLYSPVAGTLTQSTGAFVATAGAVFSQAFVGQAMDLMSNNTLFPVKVASVTDTTHLTFATNPALPANGTYVIKALYHAQSQIVQVTNATGTGCTGTSPGVVCTGAGPFTLTVTPGLYGPNWSALKGPGIWFGTWPEANFDGVSDLSMDLTNSPNAVNGVLFLNANNSWVKNYRSINGITSHIEFVGSAHNTIQSCYLYGTRNATTQSYGVEHFNGGDNLIHNCIFQHISSATIIGHSFGTVFANNFTLDNYGPAFANMTITATSQSGNTQTYTYTGLSGSALSTCINICPISIAGTTNGGGAFNHTNLKWASATGTQFTITVPTSATISSASEANAVALASGGVMNTGLWMHDPGVNYTLFEGNISAGTFGDAFHGHANVDTWFRNYLTGYESNKNSATIAAKITPLSRYHNFIGNLFGDNQATYKGLFNSIYYLAPENLTQDAQVLADPLVNTTSMFWGNYDTVSAAIRWCGNSTNPGWATTCASTSEVPTTDGFGYANTVPSSLTLPASFFYSAAPSYNMTPQGTVPFPAIGPDVTASATGVGIAIAPDLVVPANLAPANHAWNNAAETCYYNSPVDSAYPLGMDRGVLLFNATNCYSSSAPTPTASLTPNPLAFGNQNVNTTSGALTASFFNSGTVAVSITAINITGHFTLSGGTCTTSTTLTPGNSCTIGATFSPNATGPFTGTLSVTSNAVPSPTVINLTGTGTQATITWSSPQGGAAYNFGNIPVSSSINSANLTLTNSGTGPLTVTPTIGGANPAQFSIISNTCPGSLGAGLSCTFVVRFTATAATTYTASLIETDSNASNSPQSLTMSGSGFIPVVNPVVPWPPIILSP